MRFRARRPALRPGRLPARHGKPGLLCGRGAAGTPRPAVVGRLPPTRCRAGQPGEAAEAGGEAGQESCKARSHELGFVADPGSDTPRARLGLCHQDGEVLRETGFLIGDLI